MVSQNSETFRCFFCILSMQQAKQTNQKKEEINIEKEI